MFLQHFAFANAYTLACSHPLNSVNTIFPYHLIFVMHKWRKNQNGGKSAKECHSKYE